MNLQEKTTKIGIKVQWDYHVYYLQSTVSGVNQYMRCKHSFFCFC